MTVNIDIYQLSWRNYITEHEKRSIKKFARELPFVMRPYHLLLCDFPSSSINI